MHDANLIDALTAQVNEIAQVCARLSKENDELRGQVSALSSRHQLAAPPTPATAAAEPGRLKKLTEHRISRRTIGVVLAGFAAGVAGSAVLTDPDTHPASAAQGSAHAELTAVEETAASSPRSIAPAVVKLADAPSIAVNATLGNDFRVMLTSNRTMANPIGGVDGQRITFTITQGSDGRHKIAWSNQYKFGSVGVPVLSGAARKTDVIGFVYNQALGGWLCVGVALGF